MSQYQIFQKDTEYKAVNMDKFTSPDDVKDLQLSGFLSIGFIDADTEESALELANQGSSLSTSPASSKPEKLDDVSDIPKVSVVDINMPFGSMVFFMVKWAIASIPALLILSVFYMLLSALFGSFLF